MISQPFQEKPSVAAADESNVLPFSIINDIRTATNSISPEYAVVPQKTETSSADQFVSIQQSKLQGLIDALLATTAALRQILPNTGTKDDLEEGRNFENHVFGPRIPSFGREIHRLYGAEDLQQILETQPDSSHILVEEDMNTIREFCQAYPESRLDDPNSPDKWSFSALNLPSSSQAIEISSASIKSRKELQAKILQALFGFRNENLALTAWAFDSYSWEYSVGPYLVLLGQESAKQWPVAIQSLATESSLISTSEPLGRIFDILAAVCRSTYGPSTENERINWSQLTFGACLKECYRQGLLLPAEDEVQLHAKTIMRAVGLVDIAFTACASWTSHLVSVMSSEELIKTRLSEVICRARLATQGHKPYFPGGLSEVTASLTDINELNPHDLSIQYLISVGKLRIRWTSTFQEHLKLYLGPQIKELKIFWFGSTMDALPCYGLYNCGCTEHPNLENMVQELGLTYKFLFGSSEDIEVARKIRKFYGQQAAPNWITGFYSTERHIQSRRNRWFRQGRSLADFIDVNNIDLSSDVGLHLSHTSIDAVSAVREYTYLTETTSYKQFPIFQQRIRILKHYMDQRKARSLRDLWRDKRDTLSWYTFWAVIIVGGIGLILTLASLSVSSAQTAAAFRALDLPSGNQLVSDIKTVPP